LLTFIKLLIIINQSISARFVAWGTAIQHVQERQQ